jgi:hypothetical protein
MSGHLKLLQSAGKGKSLKFDTTQVGIHRLPHLLTKALAKLRRKDILNS